MNQHKPGWTDASDDEINLAAHLRSILEGNPEDDNLRRNVVRAAILATRLGDVIGHTTRALLRAALRVSPHPDAKGILAELGRRGDIVDWAIRRNLDTQDRWAKDGDSLADTYDRIADRRGGIEDVTIIEDD